MDGALQGQVRLANGRPLPDDCPVSLQVGPPLTLQSQASDAFVVSLDSSSLSSAGLFNSVVSVTTSAESVCIPFQDEMSVRVMDHLELKSVKLAVDGADVPLKYPSTLEAPLEPVEAVTIEVAVATSLSADYIPEQAFLLWKVGTHACLHAHMITEVLMPCCCCLNTMYECVYRRRKCHCTSL